MNIVIVGNPKTNDEIIKSLANSLSEEGLHVRYPTLSDSPADGDLGIIQAFERIDWANLVIAIPRDGLNLEHSTTSAIAYAKHAKKPVLLYYN